ncbi:MAG: protein kinase [Rhodothermales bacterium]|nr:protein kinase [Rhodothermales bacterium]
MEPARWQQIKELFEEALRRAPQARSAYLATACRDDAALREEVEALLASHEQATAERRFESPLLGVDAAEAPPASAVEGQQVGAYRIVEALGQGGMGAVYLAERADKQFDKQVAIKLIRRGFDSELLRRRFWAERRILARLEHPHIAHLYDGGVTEDGLPYLIMEYVEGRPIDEYCNALQLSTDDRLRLFLEVCEAVHYAHQNLIVHRDLKPSNILVTREGSVKLLDFGIAKLLDEEAVPEDPGAVPLTRAGVQMMTPEYAAPEQVRPGQVTTATDVYSLGVILYELLAGQRPYRLSGRSRGEVERIICDEEPARPSTAVTRPAEPGTTRHASPEEVGRMRATQPSRLRRRLAGDLDVIVMTALRKDPARRYPSAQQLADDLRRHLDGRPVVARSDTLSYRAAKFIRRNWLGVAASAAVFVALLGGFGVALWQAGIARQERLRAEQRFDDVRHLANDLLFDFHDALVDLPGATPIREMMVARALAYLDTLAREAHDESALRLELAEAYRRIAEVQGNPANPNLGQTDRAAESYRKGLALAAGVLDAPGSPRESALQTYALLLAGLGEVLGARGDLAAADTSLRAAVVHYRELAERYPDDVEHQVRYAVGLIKLGDLTGNPNFTNRGDPDAALRSYRLALPLLERSRALDATHARAARLHGLIYERIGTIHEVHDSLDAALEAYRRSLDLREAFAAEHPNHADGLRDQAIAYEKMADMLLHRNAPAEALQLYERAHALFVALLEADPQNANAQVTVAISHLHQGDVAGRAAPAHLGDVAAARRHYRAALLLFDSALATDPDNARTARLRDLVRGRLDALP